MRAPNCWIIMEAIFTPCFPEDFKSWVFIYSAKNPAANKSPAPVVSMAVTLKGATEKQPC